MIEKEQEQRLRDEIIGEAKTKAERLLARARNDASKIVEKAKREAAAKRKERMAEVEKEMAHKCGAIVRGVETELKRHWLAGREERLEAMLATALEKAASTIGEAHKRSMALLANEAILALGPCHVQVYFPEKDAALVTEEWLAAIAKKAFDKETDFAFQLCPSPDAPAGLRFVTLDGRKEFDNTYASRLEKMKDSIRVMLSDE
ncbi:MAG: hypothetical protein IKS20_11735 [Victivallales bacterium]|nr:hypothetical protein [Victivallales bacterium]